MPKGVYKRSKKQLEQLKKQGYKKGHKPKCPFKKGHPYGKRYKKGQTGKNAGHYKNGEKIVGGYLYILQPSHSRASKQGYILRSHLVIEKYLGRYLTKKEVVHHINNIKDDDRIENFIVFTTQGYHTAFHRYGYYNPKYVVFDGRKLSKLSS